MKLSMMSYTMARRPDLFDLPAMFQLTAELGMDGIDLVTLHDRSAEDLRRMADEIGVPVVAHTFFADLNHPDAGARRPAVEESRRSIDAAVTLGAPVVMIPTPARGGQDRAEARRNWIAGLKEVAPFATDAGLALTVENFPGENSPFVAADDLLEAVDKVPDLKITYDNGNAATTEDPAESFRRCAEHVVHAHFKDWLLSETRREGYRRMLDGRYYRSALIGEGVVDHAACLAAMRAAGYNGCVNVEYEGGEYTPAEAVRRAVGYLRGLGDG